MFVGLLKAMRPRQWPKNGFVFVGLFFDRKLTDTASVSQTLMAFIFLCLMSGAVYLLNDLIDIESDRAHPVKQKRPLASGELSPAIAWSALVILATGSLVAGFLLSPGFGYVLLAYLLIQIAYSFWLKNAVLLDVTAVAAGFVLRIAAGVLVIEVQRFSPWLYVFGGFLALFIVLGKRRQELVLLGHNASSHRAILEEYTLDLIDRLISIVTTSAIVAYSLYTFLAEGVPENHAMMLTIPFLIFGIFRYMYLIHVRHEGGAPEEILIQDRPFQATIALFAITAFVALYFLD